VVGDLLRMGWSVLDVSQVGDDAPDLVIGRMGITQLVEVKSPLGLLNAHQRLSAGQIQWHRDWRGSRVIVGYRAEDIAREFMKDARRIKAWSLE
jgi:hypothetical protein